MPQDNTTMQQGLNWLTIKIADRMFQIGTIASLSCHVMAAECAQIAHTHYTAQLEEKDKRIAELESQIEAIRDAYGLRE